MAKKFKILNVSSSAVLLKYTGMNRFMVRDVENDVIYSGPSYDEALMCYQAYDIREVREEREASFHNWLRENA
jgi:uncharacterized protein YggL (DUF469 family)